MSLPDSEYLTEEEFQALLDDDDVAAWLDVLANSDLDPNWGLPVQRGGAGFNAAANVNVERIAARHSPRFNLNFERFRVTVRNTNDVPVEKKLDVIISILQHVLDEVLINVGADDRVRIILDSNHLPRGAIFTPIINKDQLTVDRWMLAIEQVLNSQQEFRIDDSFEVTVEFVKTPSGGCKKDLPALLARKLRKKRCVVRIQNRDDLCMARALVVGKALADGKERLYAALKRADSKEQGENARSLHRVAKVPQRVCSIEDIPAFEKVSDTLSVKNIGDLTLMFFSGSTRISDKSYQHFAFELCHL